VLAGADLAVVNLETAVTEGGQAAPKKYTFRAPSTAFSTLKAAGVDVASMANNHGMDYGLTGLRDSLAASKTAGLPVVGIGLDDDQAFAPYLTRIKGQRIAVIGATQVLDSNLLTAWTAGPGKPVWLPPRTRRACSPPSGRACGLRHAGGLLHWGQERSSCPLERQRTLARGWSTRAPT
jgi:poly-gamma-glutamate synthesis protein (capsule biosynthesis protein)